VRHDNLLDQRKTEPRSPPLRRDKRPEDALAIGERHSRAIVVDGHAYAPALDAPIDDDRRNDGRIDAGFDRIPQYVAERLSQQHFIAFDDRKLAAHGHLAATPARLGPYVLGGALRD
jgi:hypothetical protein